MVFIFFSIFFALSALLNTIASIVDILGAAPEKNKKTPVIENVGQISLDNQANENTPLVSNVWMKKGDGRLSCIDKHDHKNYYL